MDMFKLNSKNNNKKNVKKMKIKDVYTIVDFPKEDTTYGEFSGASPKRAADKAFTKLYKLSKINNNSSDFLVFTIKNKRTNKEYKYIGKRIKLIKPIVVSRGGKEITYKYINTIGKYRSELNSNK